MQKPIFEGKHPVQTNSFKLPTPAIQALSFNLGLWLDNGTPGGMVVAPPSYGKTFASRYFKEQTSPIPKVPVVRFRMPREMRLSIGQFAELLLSEFGHKDPRSGSTLDKTQRIAPYLASLAQESGEGSVFVMVDDAQEMDEEEFGRLANLYDHIQDLGARACFVLFAEPKLVGRRDSLSAAGKNQLVRRFMTSEHYLPAILNVDDLADYLSIFDEKTEFPDGSGWSYSRYYFPDQFARDWRLKQEADRLFQAFKNVYDQGMSQDGNAQVAWAFEITMQYLMGAVKYGLIANSRESSTFDGFSIALWEQAVRFSGFVSASRYRSPPQKLKSAQQGR